MATNPLSFESLNVLLSIKETELLLKALEFYAHEMGHIQHERSQDAKGFQDAGFPTTLDARDLHFYLSSELSCFLQEHQDRWETERQEREDSKSLSEGQPHLPIAATLAPLMESLVKVAMHERDFSPPIVHRFAYASHDVEINEDPEFAEYLAGSHSLSALKKGEE